MTNFAHEVCYRVVTDEEPETLARRLSISLILQELGVRIIRINGQQFNLEQIRNEERRFPD